MGSPQIDFRAIMARVRWGSVISKTLAVSNFRLKPEQVASFPLSVMKIVSGKKIVRKRGYRLRRLIPAAIARHGSLEKLAEYQLKLSRRRLEKEIRQSPANVERRQARLNLDRIGGLRALPDEIAAVVSKWISVCPVTGPSETAVVQLVENTLKIQKMVDRKLWEMFKPFAVSAILDASKTGAALEQFEDFMGGRKKFVR